MLRLKVRWSTEVYEIESMFSKAKKTRGFLNPNNMPVDKKKR